MANQEVRCGGGGRRRGDYIGRNGSDRCEGARLGFSPLSFECLKFERCSARLRGRLVAASRSGVSCKLFQLTQP
jgi:hypothetical protein